MTATRAHRLTRSFCSFVFFLLGLAAPGAVSARVGPPVEVRWSGEWPTPARPGVETVGRFELVAGPACTIENLRLEGAGWSVRALDAPGRLELPARGKRVFTFRAVPTDDRAPLVVTGTANGIRFRKLFRLDEERLSSIGKRDPIALEELDASVLAPKNGPSSATSGTLIRFRGRIVYPRQDNLVVGVDNIVVKAMDKDPAPVYEEMMGFALTDHQGYFDFTVDWLDIDNGVQDIPDVFLLIEAANLVVHIRADDTNDLQDWSSEDTPITDYTGDDLYFGSVSLDPSAQAAHIYNSIIKADRHAREQGGMNAPLVYVHWPDPSTTAYYSSVADEIHIGASREWLEGTHVHEFGHHLSRKFSVLNPTDYENGFCDTPAPSHCLWCPENDGDAWQEGWANWFGDRLMRVWEGAYGYVPLLVDRYPIETTSACGDGTTYAQSNTEGFVSALLRDIEDGENEGLGGGLFDCAADVLNDGDQGIFNIFRDSDPSTVWDFIAAWRTSNSGRQLDLWHTIEHNAPSMNFTRPALQVTSQPPACRRLRAGGTLVLEAGSNSALASYRWYRDGVALSDSDPGIEGALTRILTIGPLAPQHSGSYQCRIVDCGTPEQLWTTATQLDVDPAYVQGPFVSWGVNGAGTVGDGTASNTTRPPYLHGVPGDIVDVDGGHPHTVALTASGDVWSWGTSNVGELGRGFWFGAGYTPQPIVVNDAGLSGVADIACGNSHTLAVEQDGRIRSWGSNFYGQLFTGNRDDANAPGFTLDVGCVRSVAAGSLHSLALLEDGTVRSIGYNGYGNLGNGATTTMELVPQQPNGLTNVIAIDAADLWSMALCADGTVWTWGINTHGNLGLGHYNTVSVPTQVPGLTGVRAICAAPLNAYALKNDGSLWAWGYGPALGIGWDGGSSATPQLVPLANVSKIVGGYGWAMARVGSQVRAWGLNADVNPSDNGLFNTQTNYVVPSPILVPGIQNVTDLFAGWTTAHAVGALGTLDVTPPGRDGVPTVLALAAAPNPAREAATIQFDLPQRGAVALGIYDVAGRLVRRLADESFEPGRYSRTWDGSTDAGTHAAAGLYYVRLAAPGGRLTKAIARVE